MIPAPFEYERADSVDHALELLGRFGGEAKVLAGGHSLIPLMKLRFATPTALVDIGRLVDLAYVRDGGDHLAIGALTTYRALVDDELLRRECGLIPRVASVIGDVQVRERGTIGGSVAHADPASDLPAALVALEATMVLTGPAGERTVPASGFFESFLTSALAEDELLTELRVPKLGGWGFAYEKFTKRSSDWAIVGVAAAVRRENGSVAEARVGLCNMGATPLRAASVESALAGEPAGTEAFAAAAAEVAADGSEVPEDLNATAAYRGHLARVLTRRALERAARA
ncbi:MAG: xanthine dehydrogenase family protein subunit M [Actinomycetota bacterium]|nr:xanthine dehydrogenase family protein subunit M [Actinomycetota bacterium]